MFAGVVHAQVPRMDYAFNGPDALKGWSHTKGTAITTKDDYVQLDSSHWDCKLYRIVDLPAGHYNIYGEGSGSINVYLRTADFKGDTLPGINISHPENWRTDYRDFSIPAGRYAIVVKVNGPKDQARIKWLKVETAPEPEGSTDPIPTHDELGKFRPDPQMVRGMMIGTKLTDDDYQTLQDWGVNVVRVQFHPHRYTLKSPDDFWTNAWPQLLKHLENQVKLARAHGMKAVIDMHSPITFGKHGDRDQWDDPNFEANMIRGWKDIVTHLKPLREHIWAYELWNEPLDRNQLPWAPRQWRSLAIKLVKAIRAIDDQSWIVYGPGPGGMWRGIEHLKPLPDKRIIYTFHWYSPGSFTHQGVHVKADTDLTVANKSINNHYPGENDSNGGKEYWDKDKLQFHMQPIVDFQKKWNVPVFIGEFSVVRWAPVPDGANWLNDSIDLFEQNNWSWTYHAFREWPGWSLEHPSGPDAFWFPGVDIKVLMTKATEQTDRATVVKQYLKRNGQ
jgi:aryl-phospho-beta-D-glucosidase BglC (GH1 family)